MKVLLTLSIMFTVMAFARADFVASPLLFSSVIPYYLAAPFFATTNVASSVRFQQVYSGTDFLWYGDTSYQITEMAFTAGNTREPEVILSNIQINFPTTSTSGDHLSNTFNQNVGSDDTISFSGSLVVSNVGDELNMRIVLDQPFLFKPRAGNLLMDVRNYETIPPFPPIPGSSPWLIRGFGNADDGSSIVLA